MFATRVFAAARSALSARNVARGTTAAVAAAASASAFAIGMGAHPAPSLCKAAAPGAVDWYKLRDDLLELLESETATNPGVDGASNGGGGAIAPMMVRLAWHCAGTYDVKSGTGGSDGATMRFKPESEHGGNAGLQHARALLEPVKRAHPNVSYADLYVYAGVLAVEACGGPTVGFRPGRSDALKATPPEQDKRFTPDGRLPGADAGDHGKEKTAQHIRDIFYRMGFNDQEIVALSGAHALGRCHTDRSGYWCAARAPRNAGRWARGVARGARRLRAHVAFLRVPSVAEAGRSARPRGPFRELVLTRPLARCPPPHHVTGARGRARRRRCRTSTSARCSRTRGPSRRRTRASRGPARCSLRTRPAS